MARRSFTPEQIIHKLRAAEVFIAQGLPVQQAARQMDVSQQTYDRWRLQQKPTEPDETAAGGSAALCHPPCVASPGVYRGRCAPQYPSIPSDHADG